MVKQEGPGIFVLTQTTCVLSEPICCNYLRAQQSLEELQLLGESLQNKLQFSSVQSLSRVQLFVTPWTVAWLPCPSPTPRAYSNSCPLESVIPPNHLILCCPLLFLPSIFPSIRVFSNEFFTSGGQSTGVLASASVLPMNIQD